MREQNDHGKPGRVVRLFALDETSGAQRFVCSFLSPLRAGRLLPSPRHAARFVSLIPMERTVKKAHRIDILSLPITFRKFNRKRCPGCRARHGRCCVVDCQ